MRILDWTEHKVNKGAREKRWLAITQSGDHATLGRHTDPTEAELTDAGRRLDELGTAGWLVVSEGGYYGRGPVTLLLVRRLTVLDGDWGSAEERWHAKRSSANL
jgi:hypothetical protein